MIEPLIDYPHPKIMLCSRFVKFHQTITKCNKNSIRTLAKLTLLDDKTVYKQNLTKIARDCDTVIDKLSPSVVKSNMEYFPLPEAESWRVPFLHNLLAVRSNELHLDNFENQELAELINYVCTT